MVFKDSPDDSVDQEFIKNWNTHTLPLTGHEAAPVAPSINVTFNDGKKYLPQQKTSLDIPLYTIKTQTNESSPLYEITAEDQKLLIGYAIQNLKNSDQSVHYSHPNWGDAYVKYNTDGELSMNHPTAGDVLILTDKDAPIGAPEDLSPVELKPASTTTGVRNATAPTAAAATAATTVPTVHFYNAADASDLGDYYLQRTEVNKVEDLNTIKGINYVVDYMKTRTDWDVIKSFKSNDTSFPVIDVISNKYGYLFKIENKWIVELKNNVYIPVNASPERKIQAINPNIDTKYLLYNKWDLISLKCGDLPEDDYRAAVMILDDEKGTRGGRVEGLIKLSDFDKYEEDKPPPPPPRKLLGKSSVFINNKQIKQILDKSAINAIGTALGAPPKSSPDVIIQMLDTKAVLKMEWLTMVNGWW